MTDQLKTMIANMPEKTGKPLEAWLEILKAKRFAKHSEAVKFLKEAHGMTHGFANTIVHLSKQDPTEEPDPVAAQYEGREKLVPIYDALRREMDALGRDVEFAPKKAYVSVRRSKQFAIIQPSTKSRLDLGLKIKGQDPEGALEASGSWNSMVTHRVRLTSLDALTDEVKAWIKTAYEQAG